MNETAAANDLTRARLNALFELKEWQKLLIHFDLAPDHFAFIPVIVPDSSWAKLCQKSLADFLRETEKKQLLVVHLKTPDELKNLASTFFDLKPKKKIGAVWISAPIPFRKKELEKWQTAWREAMARLNQYRNPFREKFDVPVLLIGAEWIKEIARNMAPDLWSVITIAVRIEPPVTNVGDLQKTEATAQQFEGWRGVDPDFALREAERLRGKKGQELALARLLYRAANGFYARAKYREALQHSTEAAEIIEKLLKSSTEKTKNEIESFYADILNNKGNALNYLGRLNEAIAEYDKAIINRESLIATGRKELANDSAIAFMNKGVALLRFGRPNEAIINYDRAITIREQLMKAGRPELANDLAMVYINKGVALRELGRLNEAVVEYDKAIAIYEPLVEAGRPELANDLAMAYLNKGIAFKNLRKLNGAIAEYDKAIAIYEPLVETGRPELANDLAAVYLNKGNALELQNNSTGAATIFGEAIKLWEGDLQSGFIHNIPKAVKALRARVTSLIRLKDWENIAVDAIDSLSLFVNFSQDENFSEHFKQQIGGEFAGLLYQIKQLSSDDQEKIFTIANEKGQNQDEPIPFGDILRQYVEQTK